MLIEADALRHLARSAPEAMNYYELRLLKATLKGKVPLEKEILQEALVGQPCQVRRGSSAARARSAAARRVLVLASA